MQGTSPRYFLSGAKSTVHRRTEPSAYIIGCRYTRERGVFEDMPIFSLTDDFSNPVTVPVNWGSPSALYKYMKSETLHLVVFPDFIQHKDELIAQITPQPLNAQLKVGNKFQLGGAQAEIDITPEAQVAVRVNAKSGSNLFDGDPFAVAATV